LWSLLEACQKQGGFEEYLFFLRSCLIQPVIVAPTSCLSVENEFLDETGGQKREKSAAFEHTSPECGMHQLRKSGIRNKISE